MAFFKNPKVKLFLYPANGWVATLTLSNSGICLIFSCKKRVSRFYQFCHTIIIHWYVHRKKYNRLTHTFSLSKIWRYHKIHILKIKYMFGQTLSSCSLIHYWQVYSFYTPPHHCGHYYFVYWFVTPIDLELLPGSIYACLSVFRKFYCKHIFFCLGI